MKLQKPEFIYFNRKICAWDDAKIHVSSEAVFRGLNCFEGLKAYWQTDGSMGVVALKNTTIVSKGQPNYFACRLTTIGENLRMQPIQLSMHCIPKKIIFGFEQRSI